jgi:hypothetical protein
MLFFRLATFVAFFCSFASFSEAQDSKGVDLHQAWGIVGSYSPDSQGIWVGQAEGRRITQAGVSYSRLIKQWSHVAFSYQGVVEPLFLESDPTIAGIMTSGQLSPQYFDPPYRPIFINGNYSVGTITLPGPRETTYAFAATPFGMRFQEFPKRHIQPTLSLDLGALYATRDIPIDDASTFNFLAYVGPGVEVFLGHDRSVRFEYLFEHLSNAHLGVENPGIDSSTFRLTLSRYR